MTNYNNKGGRPKSPLHKKKSRQLNIKLATMDYLSLQIRAGNANMSVPDFVRSCIVKSEVVGRLKPYENDKIRELINMGNNLNQIAKKANQAGFDVINLPYFDLATKIDDVINLIKNGSENNG